MTVIGSAELMSEAPLDLHGLGVFVVDMEFEMGAFDEPLPNRTDLSGLGLY